MGIFSTIFRRKKKVSSYTIEISQLEPWLDQESKELITKTKLDQELLNYINTIQVKRHELETLIQSFEQNIPSLPTDQQEEPTLLLVQIKKLLGLLTFSEPRTLKKSIETNIIFQKYLEMTLKKIEESRFAQDPTFLLTEADPQSIIHPLTQHLMEYDSFRSNFDQKISQSGYRNFEVLYRKSQSLQECHNKHLQLLRHLQEKKDRLQFTLDKKEEKMTELSNLKQDPDYLALQEIYAKRQQLVEQLEENNDHIFLFFSKIKPALQFYKHQHPNSWLIDLYLEEPSTAISHDENLEILPILEQLEEQLTTDSDLLSPEDIELFLTNLTKVHERYIQGLQSEFYALKSELNQIDLSLKSRYFIFKIQESNYRVEHFTTQVEKLREEIAHLEDEINEIKDLKTREQQFLENTAKISLNKELNITFDMDTKKQISPQNN